MSCTVSIKEVIKMPGLSKKTLEKRFQCDYCGETFRTRQGLSGHVQFKHQALNKPETGYAPFGLVTKAMSSKAVDKKTGITKEKITKVIDTDFILSKQIEINLWRKSNGLAKSTSDDLVKLLIRWGSVRGFFDMLDIELTEHDFKTYLLAGMGKIFS